MGKGFSGICIGGVRAGHNIACCVPRHRQVLIYRSGQVVEHDYKFLQLGMSGEQKIGFWTLENDDIPFILSQLLAGYLSSRKHNANMKRQQCSLDKD